jgi:hypothetical protein
MATLFVEIIDTLLYGIRLYVSEHYHTSDWLSGLENQLGIAFDEYKKWLKHNEELRIGANHLTDIQLFWMARAVSSFKKHQKNIPIEIHEANRLINEYLNIFYKNKEGFQEAFGCEFTADYAKRFEEFGQKRIEVYKRTKT